MADERWGKAEPQESGWFWARLRGVGSPIVIEFIWTPVSIGEGKVRLIPKVRYPGQDGLLDIEPACNMYEWLGPITPADAEQLVSLRTAAQAALEWIDVDIERWRCVGHDQPTHCVDCDLRHKAKALADQLRAALNPKG